MVRRLACVMLLATAAAAAEPTPTAAPVAASDAATAASDSVAVTPATVEVIDTPVGVVRAGPGTQHAIVATVRQGDVLTLDAKSGPWYHLRLADAKSGWMHEDLLRTYIDPRKFEFAPDPGKPSRMRAFHVIGYGGMYAADREDNGFVAGARVGYGLTRRFGFEAGAGYTHVVRTTYVIERIYGLRLEQETFDLFYYEAGFSWDVFPGRRVTPFVVATVGASVLNAKVEPTYGLGLGTKLFLTKRTGLRWEIRDHRLRGGNQFTRFSGDNLEFSGGVEILF